MVIWGRTDPDACRSNSARRWPRRMKGELVVLECGHWWPFERPEWRPPPPSSATGPSPLLLAPGRCFRA